MKELYECLKSEYKYGYQVEYFWISGVFLVLVGSFGMIGNLMNLLILFQTQFRKETYYQLLIVNTIVDIYFILCFGIQTGYGSMICWENFNEAIWNLTKPFVNVGRSLSIYTTLVISTERFLKVCYPFRLQRRSFWHYLVFIFIFSLSYNLPEFFERRFFLEDGILYDEWRPYTDNEDYLWRYWMVTDFFVMMLEDFIAMPIVLFLNLAIIRSVWKSKSNAFTDATESQRRRSVTKHSAELTKSLLIFVAVFLLTRSVYICIHYLYYFAYDEIEKWIYLEPIEGLLVTMNSSIYIIIYILVDSKFRLSALKLIKCRIWGDGLQSSIIYTLNNTDKE